MKVMSDKPQIAKWIETPMSISEFDDNARFENIKSVVNFVLNLLFMRPGTVPSLPKMGFNLRERRHYLLTAKNIARENEELQTQISTYIPNASISSVALFPQANDHNGDIDTTAIVIKFVTNETITILDDGKNTSIGYKNKDFTK